LFARRNNDFNFCCFYWPELLVLLKRNKTVEGLRQVLNALYDNEFETSTVAREFIGRVDALWEYYQSERFSDDPEQISNAMAGYPELKWRTSLNRCQRKPIGIALGPRVYRHHLKRKYPDVLSKIDAAQDEQGIRDILHEVRSKDEAIVLMKKHPDLAKEWL